MRDNYADFFELFGGFCDFVDFFHFQDLVTPGDDAVKYFLPFEGFKQSGLPTTTEEYIAYRENVLDFISARGNRMADWVQENRRDVEVHR
jgi:hypothetical protein